MENLSIILNILFGGGLVTVITLDHIRRKKALEADDADIINTHKALETQRQFFIEPLTQQVGTLQERLRASEEQCASLREQCARLTEQCASLREQCARLTAEVESIRRICAQPEPAPSE